MATETQRDLQLTHSVAPAIVLGMADGRLKLRMVDTAIACDARLALAAPYRPTAGDRVLVASDGQQSYVVGVLHAASAPGLALPDGGHAQLVDGQLELRDGDGNLILRYANGSAEIAAPRGDLTLSAPQGKVQLKAATDISFEAVRDVTSVAGRCVDVRAGNIEAPQLRVASKKTTLNSDRIEVKANKTEFATNSATMVADSIATTARTLAYNVERYELTAQRLVEKTRDTFRDVSDLLQTRVGRVRTLVDDVYALYSRRSVMVSKQDTSIDGERILLG